MNTYNFSPIAAPFCRTPNLPNDDDFTLPPISSLNSSFNAPVSPTNRQLTVQHTPSNTDSQFWSTQTPNPQETPSPSSSLTTPSPTLVAVTPLVVDNLVKDLSLNDEQGSIMQMLLEFGNIGKGLEVPDMLTRMLSMAVMFQLENGRPKDDPADLATNKAMWKDLRIRLQKTFQVTATQNKNIRLVGMDKIYDPLRTCYMDIDKDVFNHIRDHAEDMQFSNIFGNPAYETALDKAVKKVCSSIRNGFRQHIKNSVEKGISAATFTHNMNKIYQRAGGPPFSNQQILLRNVVLRRFVHDNRNTVWLEEGPDGDTAEMENTEDAEPAEPAKKRKRTQGGRVAKGKDFWSLVDTWYREHTAKLGKKLSDPGWQKLLEEYVQYDEAGFTSRPTYEGQAPAHTEGNRIASEVHRPTLANPGTTGRSRPGRSALAALMGNQ